MEACEIRVDELKQKRERDNEQVEEVGGLAMDEDGNMMTFDDGEELAYDQGYDWIHGIEKVSYGGDANDFDPNAYEDDAVGDIDEDEVFAQSPDLTLKELKRAAKIMERDGKG
jgi:hypothetical protein